MSEVDHITTLKAPSIEEVARLFPAYEVHHLIACGGMGAVYYATQLSLDRIVAIKILPREFSNDVNFRESFEAEAKAMAKLNHPNLIGIYDFGKVEGLFFIVMEYIEGQSLYHLSHGHPVEREDAIRIILGVCEGLSHAHEHGILHRDIKPSNILMDATMNPKVGDFGLAQAMGKGIEDGDQIFGTPGYTAPEVIEPPHQFDQRADVFSVAVMLQELLAGRSPNPDMILDGQLAVSNPRISAVIRAGIEPDPRVRTNTIANFADALKKVSISKKRPNIATNTPVAGSSLVGRPTAALRGRPAGAFAAKPGSALGPKPASAQEAKPESALGSKPVSALGGRPGLGNSPQRAVSSAAGDSSGTIWLLVLVAVVAVIVGVVVIKNSKSKSTPTPTAKNQPQDQPSGAPAAPTPPDKGTESASPLDAESALRKAKSAANGRLSPDYESYKRDLRQSAEKLKTDLQGIVPSATDVIDQNFSNWQSSDYRIPGALPNELSRHSGVSAAHQSAVKAQRDAATRLEERIKSEATLYVMELENLIAKMDGSSSRSAISQLEAEMKRVRDSTEYFRSLISR